MTVQKTQKLMRRLAFAGAIPVGSVALIVSYGHIHDVTLLAGETPLTATIMGLSVDGLMLTAAVAIMSGRKSPLPYLAFMCGLFASVAANVLSAEGSVVSYAVAAWPAIALTLTSELLLRLSFKTPPRKAARRKPATIRRLKAVS